MESISRITSIDIKPPISIQLLPSKFPNFTPLSRQALKHFLNLLPSKITNGLNLVMCLLRWELFAECGHEFKRFDWRCRSARRPRAARCTNIDHPPQRYRTTEPAVCPGCYRAKLKAIVEAHVAYSNFYSEVREEQRSIFARSWYNPATQRRANEIIDSINEKKAEADFCARRDLVDLWEKMWGWINIGVPDDQSPRPCEIDESEGILLDRYGPWFASNEKVLGEYLTPRGRRRRAARWVDGGIRLPSITIVGGAVIDPNLRSLPQTSHPSEEINRRSLHMDRRRSPPDPFRRSPPLAYRPIMPSPPTPPPALQRPPPASRLPVPTSQRHGRITPMSVGLYTTPTGLGEGSLLTQPCVPEWDNSRPATPESLPLLLTERT